MHATSFSCPHCSVTLRIKDRTLLGRPLNCPDCDDPFEITVDNLGELQILKIDAEESNGIRDRSSDFHFAPMSAIEEPIAASWPVTIRVRNAIAAVEPKMIGWCVASVAVVICLAVAWPFGSSAPSASVDDKQDHVAQDVAEKAVQAKPKQKVAIAPAKTRDEVMQRRMLELGKLLTLQLREEGRFPVGLVSEDGLSSERSFSWLSQLSPANDDATLNPPQWDRGWRDPLNDDFIRRKLNAYRNPLIAAETGDDGYPAAHFVGMGGVGQDAPGLPAHHSRAGVFGYRRRTKAEDIKDGAANTILLAGVAKKLGSWASGGAATVRPFVNEPYINGPDGFGTGQSNGMYVLMADGSVRFLAKQTDGKVMRRMAAMADGLDLELKLPGEPGDRPLTQPPPVVPLAKIDPPKTKDKVAKKEKPAKKAPTVTPPLPLKTVDVVAHLKQPILQFAPPGPLSLRLLIVQVEEMSGFPITYDEDELKTAGVLLEKPITVTLKNTTVGGILEAVLEKSGVRYDVLPTGIQLRALKAKPKDR